MLIRPQSDIHLEFEDYHIPPMEGDSETVLVLAGDIGLVHKPSVLTELYIPFLTRCSEQFKAVMLVMGNHEHYGGSVLRTVDKLIASIPSHLTNIHVLEKSSVVIGNVAFIGATLWTDCDKGSPFAPIMFNQMSDSRLIRTGTQTDPYGVRFTARHTMEDHVRAKQYIRSTVEYYKSCGLETVVVVHHGVTPMSIPQRFAGDELNMFFSSDMTLELMDMSPTLVIHGHVHHALDYEVGYDEYKTRVICNPRGYPGEGTWGFNDCLVVEVVNNTTSTERAT